MLLLYCNCHLNPFSCITVSLSRNELMVIATRDIQRVKWFWLDRYGLRCLCQSRPARRDQRPTGSSKWNDATLASRRGSIYSSRRSLHAVSQSTTKSYTAPASSRCRTLCRRAASRFSSRTPTPSKIFTNQTWSPTSWLLLRPIIIQIIL